MSQKFVLSFSFSKFFSTASSRVIFLISLQVVLINFAGLISIQNLPELFSFHIVDVDSQLSKPHPVKPSRFRSNLWRQDLNHWQAPKRKCGLTSPRNKSQKKKKLRQLGRDATSAPWCWILVPWSPQTWQFWKSTVRINTKKTQLTWLSGGRVVCFGCVFSRMSICLRSHAETILVPSWQHGLMQSRSVKVPFTLQSRRINRSCQHFQMCTSPLIARDEWMMCWLQSARTTYESWSECTREIIHFCRKISTQTLSRSFTFNFLTPCSRPAVLPKHQNTSNILFEMLRSVGF